MNKFKELVIKVGLFIKSTSLLVWKWIKSTSLLIWKWLKSAVVYVGLWFKGLFVSVKGNEPKVKTLVKSGGFASTISSLIAIIGGLIIGLIVLLISNPSQAFEGFGIMLTAGFAEFGSVIYYATPILLTGLSVAFAFKTGLFNIGAPGQYMVGQFCAVYVGLSVQGLGGFTWVLAVLAGIVGGAAWGFIPGIFKALLNVNEVITSIMFNYIGMYLVNMLIPMSPLVFDANKNRTQMLPINSTIPTMGLDKLFAGTNAGGGFIIAILVAITLYIILNKTKFGFEIKACGHNKNAARYAGINEKKSIILAMVIAGAVAGLGGAAHILATTGSTMSVVDILPVNGFNGIPVALLALSNPIGSIFSAVFIAFIQRGGYNMQSLNFVPEVIEIIIAVIIYFSAFSLVVKEVIMNVKKNKNKLTPIIANENTGAGILPNENDKEDK